jgi:hypothetical protein
MAPGQEHRLWRPEDTTRPGETDQLEPDATDTDFTLDDERTPS